MAKGGEFKPNKKDENENIQYYAGSENQLSMTRYLMVMENKKKEWIRKTINGLIRKLFLITFHDHLVFSRFV